MASFKKGDHILYGINGVCLIADVRRDPLSKENRGEYYVLKPVSERGSTILVPTDSESLLARMVPLPDRAELERLIDSARQQALPWIDDRKERNAEFQLTVKRGALPELLRLVVCIRQKQTELAAAGKKLPAADEHILRRAEGLIENTLSFILELELPQAEDFLRERLWPE